jgi:hypothetical protein
MIEKVNKETATKEVNSWLDYKRVKDKNRETQSAQVDVLVEALQAGDITIDEKTFEITQKLIFPVDGLVSELKYKPRISVGELQKACEKVDAMDVSGQLISYVGALTGQGSAAIKKLDPADFSIGRAVAIFFM